MPNTRINPDTGNLEIIYQRKPAAATRKVLRDGGFHWHHPTMRWWAPASNETVAIAMRVDPDFRPVAKARGKTMKGAAVPSKRSAPKANGAAARMIRFPEGTMTEADWVRNHADRVEEVRESWLNLFDRGKFNRMDYNEQARYEAELKKRAEQPVYRAWKGDKFYAVSPASYATRATAAKANGVTTTATLPPLAYGGAKNVNRRFNVRYWDAQAGSWRHVATMAGTSAAAVKAAYRKKHPGLGSEELQVELVGAKAPAPPSRTLPSYIVVQARTGGRWKEVGTAPNVDGTSGIAAERAYLRAHPGVLAKDVRALTRQPREGEKPVKHNDAMADAFARKVPPLTAPAVANRQAPPVWKKVALWNEVEFHPFAQAHATRRGWVRELEHTANGPVVKLDLTKVQTPDGEWINGAKVLDQHALSPRQGTIAVLVDGTIDAQMSAKPNGNLGEELRDRRRAAAAKPAPKASARRPARATAPPKPLPKPKAGVPADAPTRYGVSGTTGGHPYMGAIKLARNIIANAGSRASEYNRGKLEVRNLKTNRVVARWDVGPTGRFRQVKLPK